MDKEVLALKKEVRGVETDGRAGVTLAGVQKLAKNKMQERILRLLLKKSESPEELEAVICAAARSPLDGAGAALVLADFILDFKDYLG